MESEFFSKGPLDIILEDFYDMVDRKGQDLIDSIANQMFDSLEEEIYDCIRCGNGRVMPPREYDIYEFEDMIHMNEYDGADEFSKLITNLEESKGIYRNELGEII